MSKFSTFGDYPKESLASSEKALLTAWRSLERYHDDLVLVGGLAVHYLMKPSAGGLPSAVTMDVVLEFRWPRLVVNMEPSNLIFRGWASSLMEIASFALITD